MKLNKYLIGRVLNSKVEKISEYRGSANIQIIYAEGELKIFDVINKYELMHKMKEWTEIEYGYAISSDFKGCVGNAEIMGLDIFFGGENEFEAVYNAFEYIIKELKK